MVIEFDSSRILSKKEREEHSVRVLLSIRIQDSMTKNYQQYMQPSRSTSVKIRKRTLSKQESRDKPFNHLHKVWVTTGT